MSRVLAVLPAALALVVFALFVPSASPAPSGPELLPDLDQEFPSQLQVTLDGTRAAPHYKLGFRSAVRNIGDGPLVISGHRSADSETMTADQLVERRDGSRDLVPGVGTLRYVDAVTHQHWHYRGFDHYQLRRAGSPQVLETDGKSGFCLGDRYPVTTTTVVKALPRPVYIGACGLGDPGLLQVEEGISVGWGDDYPAFVEYQDLPLDGLADGRYVLIHRVNADHKLRELSYANDASSILLDLHWVSGVPHLSVLASCPDSGVCDGVPAKSQPAVRRPAVRRPAVRRPAAHASGTFVPDDSAGGKAGGWAALQWNFAGPNGVEAPHAWANLIAAGAPGGAGVTVAVLDTGIASGDLAPDIDPSRFVPGWDFIDNDPSPVDPQGHGTAVAETIAEDTNNAYGLTGLAYGARIMPVRVLDGYGGGDAPTIARGVVFAVDHGAKVVNLSLNFAPSVTADQIPQLLRAFAYARRHGVLVVAAAGNDGSSAVDFPARAPGVLSVGATTEFGCAARYSDFGSDLDVVAPGGGTDATLPGDPSCEHGRTGRPIFEVGRDGAPPTSGWVGTSFAAPHVAAIAALIVAGRVLGADPSPAQLIARIEQTARDLGVAGRDVHYGWGLVDAGAATARAATPAAVRGARRVPPARHGEVTPAGR